MTDGAPGATLNIPTYSPPPGWQPPPNIFPPFPSPPYWGDDWNNNGLTSNVRKMAAFLRADFYTAGGLAKTINFGDGALTSWTVDDWRTILGLSPSGVFATWGACPNAFSYTTGGDLFAWLLWHLDGAIHVSYINVTDSTLVSSFDSGLVAEYSDVTALTQGGIDASFGTENHVVATVGIKGQGTYAIYTNGVSPTSFHVSTIEEEGGTGQANSGVWVSSKSPGLCYATGYKNTTQSAFYKSVNYGATWTEATNPSLNNAEQADAIVSPHDDSRNPSDGWHFAMTSDGLARSTVSGDYDLLMAGADTIMRSNRNVLAFIPGDARTLMFRRYDGFDQPSFSSNPIYKTINALDASPSFSAMAALAAYDVWSLAFSGDNPSVVFGWGGPYHTDYNWAHDIILSLNGGTTAVSQLGNLTGGGHSAHILMGMG